MTITHSLTDTFGRHIDYLRVSITDRCNLSCVYCAPTGGWPLMSKQNLLSFEQITEVAKAFLNLGGQKIRITGGEPLMRKNITTLIAMLSSLPGLKTLGLTSNGVLLSTLARGLKDAGLQAINVSLDALDARRFVTLTGVDKFTQVMAGIDAALNAGIKTKINVVVMNGITDNEILKYGELARVNAIEVRFIEFMPLCGSGWRPDLMYPIRHVRDILKDTFNLVELPRGDEVAQSFKMTNGLGRVGFIASMTEPFCGSCSRLRLTSNGRLRSCLFSNAEIDLKPCFLNDDSQGQIQALIQRAVKDKPMGHDIPATQTPKRELPFIRFTGG